MRRSLLITAFLLPALAMAEDEGPPTEAQPAPVTTPLRDPASLFGMRDAVSAVLGAGKIDGDYYIQSTAMFDFDLGDVRLGVGLPLNLLVYSENEPPTRADKTYFGVIRKADYPAPTLENYGQYLRLIRYLQLGQKRDPLYVYYGQMFGASIGHGTIVNRYNNSLDLTKPRNGLAVDVNTKWGGFETLVNDIAWPSTNIAGGRVYARPLGDTEIPIASKWAIGFSLITDRLAPRTLKTSATDAQGQACASTCVQVGSDGLPVADRIEAFTEYGVDTEIEVFHNSIMTLVPYVDFNLQPRGNGLHAGVQGSFRFPILGALKLWSRAELRVMSARYIPDYFDAAYDQQRYVFPIGTLSGPKAEASLLLAPDGTEAPLRVGYFAEATADVLGMVKGGATFTSTPGVPNSANLMVFATVPYFETIKVSGYYLRKNFDAASELLTLDERSILTGSANYKLYGPLFVGLHFSRSWRTDPSTGQITASNDWNLGLQLYQPL